MRADIAAYATAVLTREWPAQTAGRPVPEAEPHLTRLTTTALHLRPGTVADGNVHALLLADLGALATARRQRLFAARTSIPTILWGVLIAGGTLTVAFASFLGSPSLRMHMAMTSLLADLGRADPSGHRRAVQPLSRRFPRLARALQRKSLAHSPKRAKP